MIRHKKQVLERVFLLLSLLALSIFILGCNKGAVDDGLKITSGGQGGNGGQVDEGIDESEESVDDLMPDLEGAVTCEEKKVVFSETIRLSKNELEDLNDEMNRLVRDIRAAKQNGNEEEEAEKEGQLQELSDKRQELRFRIEFLEKELADFDC